MKICLQEYDSDLFAGNKAKSDMTKILESEGYKPLFITSDSIKFKNNTFFRRLKNFYDKKRLCICFAFCKKIVIQWPFYDCDYVDYLIELVGKREKDTLLLIHDLDNLRNLRNSKDGDLKMCNAVGRIIVHTDAMKSYLIDNDIESDKIRILTSFDYLTSEDTPIRELSNRVVFAGNIKKSPFLKLWDKSQHRCQILCYGSKPDHDFASIEYKGRFLPENVSSIEGSWGLVWDGDSIEECAGNFGQYLRYNSPHKLSLYCVAGLPVIVWSESALAQYVMDKEIGVIVSSLDMIDYVVNNTTIDIYNTYRDNILRVAKELKTGSHLKALL